MEWQTTTTLSFITAVGYEYSRAEFMDFLNE
jgi:hypothetical protein